MKLGCAVGQIRGRGRPPRGGRGLKLIWSSWLLLSVRSPPSRGAWIEIKHWQRKKGLYASPPSRGAWIEILWVLWIGMRRAVAPLAGGVD